MYRRVYEPFSPEILQAGVEKGLMYCYNYMKYMFQRMSLSLVEFMYLVFTTEGDSGACVTSFEHCCVDPLEPFVCWL